MICPGPKALITFHYELVLCIPAYCCNAAMPTMPLPRFTPMMKPLVCLYPNEQFYHEPFHHGPWQLPMHNRVGCPWHHVSLESEATCIPGWPKRIIPPACMGQLASFWANLTAFSLRAVWAVRTPVLFSGLTAPVLVTSSRFDGCNTCAVGNGRHVQLRAVEPLCIAIVHRPV